MPRAVFLDRDGTINRDVPYCSHPCQLELLPGAAEAIATLNCLGFKVVVITNQSGVGRGYYTKADLTEIHIEMRRQLFVKGAYIDAIYYCPHHPEDPCLCRKPKTALAWQAARNLCIDLASSWVVGDSLHDVEMGRKLGCRTVFITQSGAPNLQVSAHFTACDLTQAVQLIEAVMEGRPTFSSAYVVSEEVKIER